MIYNSRRGCKDRYVVFAHYDPGGIVDEYVYYYLHKLSSIADKIIFVSTAKLTKKYIDKLETYCDKIIQRKNQGYDFLSYKIGIECIKLCNCDELIICNDSVYGPIYPLEQIFSQLENIECDFWGITQSNDIAWHLQSYFIVFKKNTLNSNCFNDFWHNVTINPSKEQIIRKYEIGLSTQLIKAGLRGASFVQYKPRVIDHIKLINKLMSFKRIKNKLNDIIQDGDLHKLMDGIKHVFQIQNNANPTHFFWKGIIRKAKMPFLKIELLRDNPANVDILDFQRVIKRYSDYDVGLIERHLDRMKMLQSPEN